MANQFSFKNFLEVADFGFEKKKEPEKSNMDLNPVNQFSIETLMEILSEKSINGLYPEVMFANEIKWGNQPGSIKLMIDNNLTFFIKKLGVDKLGNTRWVTKKMLQLDRNGCGGVEDRVAEEVFELIQKYYNENIEAPKEEFNELESLAYKAYNKIVKYSKVYFLPEGITKLSDDAYILKFGVAGQGVGAKNQTRIEQNQTMITYDREAGTIRIYNYNIESPESSHAWKIGVNDLDLYFFPTQNKDEISDTIAMHMKNY